MDNSNNNTITTINWNDIINHDTRSIDDADLGKVKGLYEPFIVIERGTINKEKLYIPKSLIKKYSANVLYLSITEQEAKDTYTRESPPSEDEIRQIETITENRIMASRRNNLELSEQQEAGQVGKQIQHPKSEEDEIAKKLKQAANELKDLLISGAKVAKEKIKEGKDITQEKIKEQQDAAEERKAENDAEEISKMGNLALQFSTSFDDILSEISLTRTYAEQEQIYKGFIRLLQLQRKLLFARKELASKLKGSVHEPILIISNDNNNNDIKQPQLTQGKQNQLNKASELPLPQSQLPETISTAEGEIKKSKPRMKKAEGESNIEGILDGESLSTSTSLSSKPTMTATAAAESPSTEIPSSEFTSKKDVKGKEGTAIEKRKLIKEKRSSSSNNKNR
jgi:hypothetical protein